MKRLRITGDLPVSGKVRISGNKNAALPMIAAALLTDEPVILRNMPDILDVRSMLEIAASFGATVDFKDNVATILQGAAAWKAIQGLSSHDDRMPFRARHEMAHVGTIGDHHVSTEPYAPIVTDRNDGGNVPRCLVHASTHLFETSVPKRR